MIRPYDPDDVNGVLDVWYQASHVAHWFLSRDFLDQERLDVEQRWLPRAETWVAESSGRVVGFVALIGNEVGAIFVHPEHQGQGIGRALMDHVRALRPFLELDVFALNDIGRRFYRAYGFQLVGEAIHEPTGQHQLRLRIAGSGPEAEVTRVD